MFFPCYNIAVECDEHQHAFTGKHDKVRQDRIEQKLGCTFVRLKRVPANLAWGEKQRTRFVRVFQHDQVCPHKTFLATPNNR
jgi:hypothetical protein